MAEITRTRWTTTKKTSPNDGPPTVETFEEVKVRTGPSEGITAWRIADLADALASEGCPGSAKVDAHRSDTGRLTGLTVTWKTKIEDHETPQPAPSTADTSEATQ